MIKLFLSNPFNDPSDPWYYIIGVIFLLLIFGAVGAYMFWTGKRKNKKTDSDEQKTKSVESEVSDTEDGESQSRHEDSSQANDQEQSGNNQN